MLEEATAERLNEARADLFLLATFVSAGKVYFVAVHFVVKLQADNLVRWDVAPRGLNRKQKYNRLKIHGIQIHSRRMGSARKKLRRRTNAPTTRTMAKTAIDFAHRKPHPIG